MDTWLGIISVLFVVGVMAYARLSTSSSPKTEHSFTVTAAIVLAAYLVFPVLTILAAGLLLIALLLSVAHLPGRPRLEA